MKNSYKVLGFILCAGFSGALAMNDLTDQEKSMVRAYAKVFIRDLRNNPADVNPDDLLVLQQFCTAHGLQKINYQLNQAIGQGSNTMIRQELHAIIGQPPVCRRLFSSESSESSSSSFSDSEL